MRRAVVVTGLGVVGVALAALLLRAPDTGADVPEREAVPAEPAGPPAEGWVDEQGRRHMPPRAEMEAKKARRLEPDARYANVAASAWTGVKRELSASTVDEAVVDEIGSLVNDLRAAYLAPDANRIAALRDRSDALRERVRAQPGLPESVVPLLARLDQAAATLSTETNPATAPPENLP